MIGGFQPIAFQPNYQQVGSTPIVGGGGGGGGGGRIVYRPSRKYHPDLKLKEILDEVVLEVMYGDLKSPQVPKEVRKEAEIIVKPYIEREVVDFDALERDAVRVSKLFKLWSALQQEIDDEDWFMMDS